jgi:RES domain-containing protein
LTPLPAALGGAGLAAWRIERDKHLPAWTSAEGAFLVGGRWSSPGRRVLYAALDPATAILEVAVHKGFDVLDAIPHSLLELEIDPKGVYVVRPTDVPNPNWLRPGTVSPNLQKFGDSLMDVHPIVILPSVVSTHSWNVLINVAEADALFKLTGKESFALDPRLTAAVRP